MIKPQQLAAELRRPAFRHSIIRRAHEKPAPRPLFGRVWKRHGRRDLAPRPAMSDIPTIADITGIAYQGAAAFMRIRLLAMTPDRIVHGRIDPDSMLSHCHRPSRSCRSGISLRRREKS